jgi:hypothetical protein
MMTKGESEYAERTNLELILSSLWASFSQDSRESASNGSFLNLSPHNNDTMTMFSFRPRRWLAIDRAVLCCAVAAAS